MIEYLYPSGGNVNFSNQDISKIMKSEYPVVTAGLYAFYAFSEKNRSLTDKQLSKITALSVPQIRKINNNLYNLKLDFLVFTDEKGFII